MQCLNIGLTYKNKNLNINNNPAIFYRCCYASGGGLKTRIMAYIQTPIRLINVKETYEEVLKAMDLQWMELTETSGKMYRGERKIRLNRNYIIEIRP